jgi:ABC-type branched-subunit amino acid transport system substrate-binding protein
MSYLVIFLCFLSFSPYALGTEEAKELTPPQASESLTSLAESVVTIVSEDTAEEKQEKEQEEAEKSQDPFTPEDELKIYSITDLKDLTVDHETTYPFAMVGSFTGHFRLYGTAIRNGMLARFRHINKEENGINNKWIRLICVEDNGNPNLAHKIITQLRKKHNVATFVGNMGTRNVAHVTPLIERKRIAMLFPWGGKEDLRSSHLTNLVNGLGHMEPQIKDIIEHCINGLLLKKIAIFHSDGTFYSNAKDTTVTLLKEEGLRPVALASYNRFTMDINTPAKRIIDADPKVVICLGSSYPIAKLISRFFQLGHYGTTFIGIDSTMFVPDILRAKGASYSYSSTVPNPITDVSQISQEYRDQMQDMFPNEIQNILSYSYYIHATLIERSLKSLSVSADLHTDLIPVIEKMENVDLGGFTANFDQQTRHAYTNTVTIIKG